MNVRVKHENEVELSVAPGLDQMNNGEETWWSCPRTAAGKPLALTDWLLLVES